MGIMDPIIICNLPSGPTTKTELLNVGHGMDNSTMLVPWMAEPSAQNPPNFEPPVDALMTSTS